MYQSFSCHWSFSIPTENIFDEFRRYRKDPWNGISAFKTAVIAKTRLNGMNENVLKLLLENYFGKEGNTTTNFTTVTNVFDSL